MIVQPRPAVVRLLPAPVTRAVDGLEPVLLPTPKAPVSRPRDPWYYRFWARVVHFFTHMELKAPTHQALGADLARRVQPLLKPGDVLLRRTEYTSSNVFIPSWWKHAAVYVGDGKIVEAVGGGVRVSALTAFFEEGQHVKAVRPKDASPDQARRIARWAEAQVGKPYDFAFDFAGDERFACTELAAKALERGLGRELLAKDWTGSITGDAFAGPAIDVVWCSVAGR